MAIKRKGIVIRPGTYNGEVVTREMLKRAIQYQSRIPLIVGPHPVGGYANPDRYVGTVGTSYNDDIDAVEGDYWFFEEKEHMLPDELKRKVVNYEEVKASSCYDTKLDKDKTQLWRKWDHIALGVKNPKIKDVGVNFRMESLPESLRLEEEPVITGTDKTEEPAKLEFTPEQLATIIDTAVQKALEKAPPVVEDIPKEPTEKAPEPARADPIPETVLPASAPKSKSKELDGIEVLDDGWWKF